MTAFALQLGQHPAGAGMNPLEFSGSQWDFNGISMGFQWDLMGFNGLESTLW